MKTACMLASIIVLSAAACIAGGWLGELLAPLVGATAVYLVLETACTRQAR